MSAEIFEGLSSALLNLDASKYTSILRHLPCNVCTLLTPEGNNSTPNIVFHELSLNIAKEDQLTCFFLHSCDVVLFSPDESLLKHLINQKNKDGKTCFHLGIMTGRKNLVKHYIQKGADLALTDLQGQGVIHMATVAGQLFLLTLFHKIHYLEINPKDNNGRTPLHLAALEGQEQSSTLLIAWSEDMNEVDSEGLTPLHLASAAKSYRIVRHLLMRGAKRGIKCAAGSTALMLAQRSGASEQIKEALSEPFWLSSINPIKAPLKPVTNTYTPFILYILTFYLRYILVFLFLVPNLHYLFTLAFILLCLINIILFQIVSNVDPGYERPASGLSFIELYEKYNGDYVCAYCEVRRPNHIKHCQHCNRCVRKFDHHCPWIHNCVGQNNHKVFFVFLLTTEVDFLYNCIVGALEFSEVISGSGIYRELFLEGPLRSASATTAMVTSGFSAFAFLLVLPLFYVQLVNVAKNTTTSQRFAYNVRGMQRKKDRKSKVRSVDSDTSSMLLIDEENEITQLNDRLSELSGSDISIQAVRTTCCCLKRSVRMSWEEVQEKK